MNPAFGSGLANILMSESQYVAALQSLKTFVLMGRCENDGGGHCLVKHNGRLTEISRNNRLPFLPLKQSVSLAGPGAARWHS